MEDQDLVVRHSFLSYNDFLATVDYEVATLIILAVFPTMNSIILAQTVKLAELRSKHDRDLANHNPS